MVIFRGRACRLCWVQVFISLSVGAQCQEKAEEHTGIPGLQAARTASQPQDSSIVAVDALWSSKSRVPLNGSVWLHADDKWPAVSLRFFPGDMRKVSLGKALWSVTPFKRAQPTFWNSAVNHTPAPFCSERREYNLFNNPRHLGEVKSADLREKVITFEGLILDDKELLPLSHARAVFGEKAESHSFFEPFLQGSAVVQNLLWADLAERLKPGGDLANANLVDWPKDVHRFEGRLDGLLEDDFFSCASHAPARSRGLVQLDVYDHLASASHLWVGNYGHWLSFELPALIVLSSWLRSNSSYKVLVHPLPYAVDALQLLGIEMKQIVLLDPCRLYFAHHLRTVAGLLNDMPGRETLQYVRRELAPVLVGSIGGLGQPPPSPKRALVADRPVGTARSFGEAQRRSVLALLNALCRGGARCQVESLVVSYRTPLALQLKAFMDAAFILTPDGAQAASLIWSSSASALAIVAPRGPTGQGECGMHMFSHLAEAAGVYLWSYITPSGSRSEELKLEDWSDFRRFLRWIFATKQVREALQPPEEEAVVQAAHARAADIDDPDALLQYFRQKASFFLDGVINGAEGSDVRYAGIQALQHLRRKVEVAPATGEGAVSEVKNLLIVSSLLGYREEAVKHAKTMLRLPACDLQCFCTTGAKQVIALRADPHRQVASQKLFKRVSKRCGYQSSWQMPSPHQQYDKDFEAKPWWEASNYVLAELLHNHSQQIISEFVDALHQGQLPWRSDASASYSLIESGRWRQISIFGGEDQERRTWNTAVCKLMPQTCSILESFHRSTSGSAELATKIKIFELGPYAAMFPHCGMSNLRLFVHMALLLPTDGYAYLRVGDAEPRRWDKPGQILVFDDSFEHEAWNEASQPRYVLGLEVHHREYVTSMLLLPVLGSRPTDETLGRLLPGERAIEAAAKEPSEEAQLLRSVSSASDVHAEL